MLPASLPQKTTANNSLTSVQVCIIFQILCPLVRKLHEKKTQLPEQQIIEVENTTHILLLY